MGFFDQFAVPLKAGILDMFGDPAIFTPAQGDPVDCRVKLDHDVILQPSGYDAQVVETGSTITALVSEVGEPRTGTTFLVDGETWEVARITDNDREFVTMAVVDA